MNKAELEKLIERLEKATGPDRDLDYAILKTLNDQVIAVYPSQDFATVNNATAIVAPRYSESIDAAMALAKNGSSIHLHVFRHHKSATTEAEVGIDKKGLHTTPAIALCIASLRSLIADKE